MKIRKLSLVMIALAFPILSYGAQPTWVVSNITIAQKIAIGLSDEFNISGISFETLDPDTSNNSAKGNYNATQNTLYWINISEANTLVDICINSNRSLYEESKKVEINNSKNYTFSGNNTTNNVNYPGPTDEYILPLSYENFIEGRNLEEGTLLYFRFWLDVPEAQPAGTYTNMVSFKAVPFGEDC